MNRRPVVFIVDDEPMIRRALMSSIESLDVRVCAFPSGELCIEALKEEECDLLITDMNMPGISGLELLERTRELFPLVNVMLITGFGSVASAVRSMQSGAIDFIEKPLDEGVILPKIQSALKRINLPESESDLSSTEMTILDMIGQGLANKEIAFKLSRSIRTVENHRHRIMKKLGATGTADLVRMALSIKGRGGTYSHE